MGSSPFSSPDLADLVTRRTRWGPGGRRQRPFRFLLDSRVFRLLCDPRQTAALDNFRASLARLRLAPEGGLPDLEMTPLAVLDVLGIEPPRVPEFLFPKSMATLKAVEVGSVVMQMLWRVPSYAELAASAQRVCGQRRRLLRITLWPAEGVEPGEKIALRELALGQFGQRGCRGNRLLLHPQVDLDIAMVVESWA